MHWRRFLPLALGFLLFGREPVLAQPAPSEAQQYQARVDEVVRALTSHPSLKNVRAEKRQQLAEFVVGNVSFVFLHEMAHGLVHEMDLPVLGEEENAADTFAVLSMLKLGTSVRHPLLVEAAKAWFLTDKRDKREGTQPDAYDAHGLDDQRAYRIVCLMVGSNKENFKDLADQTNLPEERQKTCELYDFPVASSSWDKALRSHRRGAEQSRQQIEVKYWPGKDELNVYEQTFRAVRLLETVATYAAEEYSWPNPIWLEMATCGESNAQWLPPKRTVVFCYELAHDFALLYRDYGQEWQAPPADKWWHPKWWKRVKR